MSDIDNPSPETYAIARSLESLKTIDRILIRLNGTEDLEAREILEERWIQLGQPISALKGPHESLRKLAADLETLKKKGVYSKRGKYTLAFEPGVAFFLLQKIVTSDDEKSKLTSLLTLLARNSFFERFCLCI